ncbi:MAG: CapA family protein [Candidatus Cloacimonetes bacterium]|nr:CapA family protein [Candidatus Cloacimonadota bacterium]
MKYYLIIIITIINLLNFVNLISIEQYDIIEDFESGEILLHRYNYYDNINNWLINDTNTFDSTGNSLCFLGNNSKYMYIENNDLDSSSVWSFAAFASSSNSKIAFGIGDSLNTLFYQIKGSTRIDSMNWIDDYLGAFSNNEWHQYFLRLGSDWYGLYEYYPTITKIFFINNGNNIMYFDEVRDHTNYLEPEPIITINTHILSAGDRQTNYTVQFSYNLLNYENDEEFSYFWSFGDGETSTEQTPIHTYTYGEDGYFKVMLKVMTNTGKVGYVTENLYLTECFNEEDISISFIGDIMLARHLGTINPNDIFNGVRDELQSTDLRVANLESPLSNSYTPHPTKTIKFQANPVMVQALVDVGIDKVSLANNHILDYLDGSLLQTQANLQAANILYSGAGLNEYEAFLPLSMNIKGKILSFLASSDRDGSYNNYQPFLQAAYNKSGFYKLKPSKLKAQLDYVQNYADIKIVEMHAGSEYSLTPSADYDKSISLNFDIDESAPKIDFPHMWDSELRHFAIDEGADIVVVHHQHIIQGFEIYNNKLIAHGLGNFVFDLSRADTKPTMILQTKINNEGFYDYKVIPAFIQPYTPRVITDDAALRILDYLVYRSREMDTCLLVDRSNFTAKIIADTSSIEPVFEDKQKEITFYDASNISVPEFIKENANFHQINNIRPIDEYHYRLGRSIMHFGGFENEDFYQWNIDSSTMYSSEEANRGLYSLKITNPVDESFSTTYRHRVMSNNEMTFYARIKQQNIQNVNVYISYYNTPGSSYQTGSESITIPIEESDTWTTIYANLNVPENTGGYNLSIVPQAVNNESYIYFDDVDIIEWDAWTPFSDYAHKSPNSYYYLQLEKTDVQNTATVYYKDVSFNELPVTTNEIVVPKQDLTVYNNYPNPFNPTTTIHFSLTKEQHIELDIYNIKGQKVVSLLNQVLPQGKHSIQWYGLNKHNKKVATGIYLYSIKTKNQQIVKKMLMIK